MFPLTPGFPRPVDGRTTQIVHRDILLVQLQDVRPYVPRLTQKTFRVGRAEKKRLMR